MTRTKSLIITVTGTSFSASLSSIEEAESLTVNGISYSPLPQVASFYEIIRTRQAGLPVGIELQLGSKAYDIRLEKLKAFRRSQISEMECAWMLLFREPESEMYIEWEQILTNNPYFATSGSALLVVSLDHLTESEYCFVESLAK